MLINIVEINIIGFGLLSGLQIGVPLFVRHQIGMLSYGESLFVLTCELCVSLYLFIVL